ncbi:MAG: alpha-glucuronidase, partial [Prevotella sp.]|nr:alpha-glucuronidase [Prevotella sp.]
QMLWSGVAPYVGEAADREVRTMLTTQLRDAVWWRDACLLYFGQFSRLPLPEETEAPVHTLDSLMRVKLPVSNYENPSPELLDKYR